MRELGDQEVTSIYRRVIANTIESGIIYPSFLLVAGILYLQDSNGQDIVRFVPSDDGRRLCSCLTSAHRFNDAGYLFSMPTPVGSTSNCFTVVSIVPTLMWLQIRLGLSQYEAATQRSRNGGTRSSIPGPIVFLHPNTTTQEESEESEKELSEIRSHKKVVLRDPESSVPSQSTASV